MVKKGFTLIELILVILILGIALTSTLVVFNPGKQAQKTRDTLRKANLSSVQRALESYYADNGRYPASDEYGRIVNSSNVSLSWGSSWSPYMDQLPKDPTSSKVYRYAASSDGQQYGLYASLDIATDSDACNSGKICTSITTVFTSISSICSTPYVCTYGVTSTNLSP